jgi:hypothetical protein
MERKPPSRIQRIQWRSRLAVIARVTGARSGVWVRADCAFGAGQDILPAGKFIRDVCRADSAALDAPRVHEYARIPSGAEGDYDGLHSRVWLFAPNRAAVLGSAFLGFIETATGVAFLFGILSAPRLWHSASLMGLPLCRVSSRNSDLTRKGNAALQEKRGKLQPCLLARRNNKMCAKHCMEATV